MPALQRPDQVHFLQEQRHLGPALHASQGLARAAGWHGVRDAAVTPRTCGRSGGTAVLFRLPLPTHRGDPVARCSVAIAPWTRTTRLHLMSVYGINRPHPDYQTDSIRLQADLQTHLASIGHVPWVLGGDWHMEPSEHPFFWQRPHLLRAPPQDPHRNMGTSQLVPYRTFCAQHIS